MNVYVCVEVYDGHRDGMRRDERPGTAPKFRNDDIHFANPAQPSEWDRRFMGYFAVDCPIRNDADALISNCYQDEGVPTLRVVWGRTPFSIPELNRIMVPVPKGQSLEGIPKITLAQFNAATVPVNSSYVEAKAIAESDKHADDKAELERKRDAEPLDSPMRVLYQTAADGEDDARKHYAALATEYSKRALREEPETARRSEIVAPPTVAESRLNDG